MKRTFSLRSATVLAGMLTCLAPSGQSQILCSAGVPCAYITEFANNTVAVFDTTTKTIVNRFPTGLPVPTAGTWPANGIGPYQIAVANTAGGPKVYVAMINPFPTSQPQYNRIAVIDPATGVTEQPLIVTDGSVMELKVSIDGTRVFALISTRDYFGPATNPCVDVIDTSTKSLRKIPLDVNFAADIAIKDDSEFFVSTGHTYVELYDMSALGTPEDTIDIGFGQSGLAYAPNRKRLYAATNLSHPPGPFINGVKEIDPVAKTVTHAIGLGPVSTPHLKLNRNETLLFAEDPGVHGIDVIDIDPNHNPSYEKLAPGPLAVPYNPNALPFGITFTLAANDQTVFAVATDGSPSVVTGLSPGFFLVQFNPQIQTRSLGISINPNPIYATPTFLENPLSHVAGQAFQIALGVAPTTEAVTPAKTVLYPGQTTTLKASPILPGESVNWTASGSVALSPSGQDIVVMAPSPISTSQTVTVTATVTGPYGTRQGTASVILEPPLQVTVTPLAGQPLINPLRTVGNIDQFVATVSNAGITAAVTWSVRPASAPVTLFVPSPLTKCIVCPGVRVTYSGPAVSQPLNIELVATSVQDPSVSGSYTLTLAPLDGQLLLTANALDFSQSLGTYSAAQTVLLSNHGTGLVPINGISVTAGAPATSAPLDFIQTNNCGTGLFPGGQCQIRVTYLPAAMNASGYVSAVIAINATNLGPGSSLSSINLTGHYLLPQLTLSPGSLNFGTVNLGITATRTVTLTDTGVGDMLITGMVITGATASDFRQTNTCGNLLSAGSACTFSVSFRPSGGGARPAVLTITGPAKTVTVPLTGVGH